MFILADIIYRAVFCHPSSAMFITEAVFTNLFLLYYMESLTVK